MPDPNQDRTFGEKPFPDSSSNVKPPWQREEEKSGEETDLAEALKEERPAVEITPALGAEELPKETMTEIPETTEVPEETDLSTEPSLPETPPVEIPIPNVPPLVEAPVESPPEEIPEEPSGPVQAYHSQSKSPLGGLKKILPIILGLIVVIGLVFLVVKFGLPRFQKQKEVTLTYWGLWEPESVMREVIDDWNKDHPSIKVNYSMQSKEQYRERLQSALARSEGPDIFRFHVTWLPMLKGQLDSVPTEVMSASQYESTFYPVAATNLRSGSSYLGIPLEIDTLALFYNKDIFQTAGKVPPATWDELRKTAIELATHDEEGKIQTAGVALGTTNNIEHWSDILGLMMLQNEADLAKPTGALAEDALDFYTIFSRTDRVWDSTLPSSMLAFANGKLAMYFGYSWDIFEIKNINPNLEFGVVQAPQLAGTNISWASFWVEGVNNKGQFKEEAWEFLQYLSSKETLVKLYQAESKVRLFGEPYSRVEMASQAKTNPLVTPFVEQASQAQTWYLCSRTYDNGINDKTISYFEDAVNTVNKGQDSTKALDTAALGINQLLSQYGLVTAVTP